MIETKPQLPIFRLSTGTSGTALSRFTRIGTRRAWRQGEQPGLYQGPAGERIDPGLFPRR